MPTQLSNRVIVYRQISCNDMNFREFADKNIFILKQPTADCSSHIKTATVAARSVPAKQPAYSVKFASNKTKAINGNLSVYFFLL